MTKTLQYIEQVVISGATYIIAAFSAAVDAGDDTHSEHRCAARFGVFKVNKAENQQREVARRGHVLCSWDVANISSHGGELASVFAFEAQVFDCIEAELSQRK